MDLPANLSTLALFFIGCLAGWHLLLIFLLKIGEITWKKLDYLWLFLAALSIIPISVDVRAWLAPGYYDLARSRAENYFKMLRLFAGGDQPPAYVCAKYNRSESSPRNFEEIQAEYNSMCEWNTKFLAKLPKELGEDFPELDFKKLAPEKPPTDAVLVNYLNTLKMFTDNYSQQRSEMMKMKGLMGKTALEKVIFYLSPIFLCFSFTLRITKVTWSLRRQKVGSA